MKHFYLRAITLSVGLLLSACGGGGGSGPSLDVGGAPGDQPMTPNQVRTQFVELGKMADHLQMTGLQVWYGPSAGTTVGDDCFEAARCNPATDEFGLIFTPENLSTIPRDAEIQSRGTRQGVPLVEYSGDSNAVLEFGSLNRPNSVDYRTLGGWMEHNFFTVNRWTFEGTNWQIWNAASAGMESGSNPVSGSATWTGTMVGRTRGAESYDPGVLVTGDSGLTFDFATNEIDVTLTGIRSDANESYPDITWDNVPVRDGGFVSRSGFVADGSVQGGFYGPNHEEVGGVFERESMLGAFGATRQQ